MRPEHGIKRRHEGPHVSADRTVYVIMRCTFQNAVDAAVPLPGDLAACENKEIRLTQNAFEDIGPDKFSRNRVHQPGRIPEGVSRAPLESRGNRWARGPVPKWK